MHGGGAIAGITFEPISVPADVSIDTVFVDGVEYHQLLVEGYALQMDGIPNEGLPSIPFTSQTLLLKPDMQVDSIKIASEQWEVLPGKYFLYPAQSGLFTDSIFTLPDSTVYNSTEPFPSRPIEISKQGSALGYSVVSLTGTPIRYIPADSTLMVLTRVTVVIKTKPSGVERIVPNRETQWSAAMRERGILSMISNPEALVFYRRPAIMSFESRTSYLNITQSPSPEGDGVDMVIITTDELEGRFEQVADYRTQQGIVTVVRTVEWIDQFYSGCDTPERIRNFVRDAHEEWGIQAVILGGDAEVVPVRECKGWAYETDPYPEYQLPSDDYFADIDGEWSNSSSGWEAGTTENYLDLCLGRWPVDNGDDIDLMFTKLKLYEWPDDFPADFARKMLLMGSIGGADDMIELVNQLNLSGVIPEYLNYPTELYYPHELPGGNLSRNTALAEFDQGYNLIIHADHSGVHEIGTAGSGALGEAMYDYDFGTMTNINEPSILWTYGCDPGWFDGADCFAEAGLLTAYNSGLVAVIANSRYGLWSQEVTFYSFCDALFNTGWIPWINNMTLHWPLSYLGEAHRCSKNNDGTSFNMRLNLFGSPLMYVWRDDPMELFLSVPPLFLREGIPQDITVTVTDGVDPVENATVCLWKKNEIFSVLETNVRGRVTFDDVCIADGDQDVVITAVKRRRLLNQVETTVVSYIPDRITIDVMPADIPIVSLESFSVDAVGDGTANPGETVDIYLTAKNSGGETALNVTAELSLVSGGEYIAGISDDEAAFPVITVDQTENSTDPFTISINSDVASYSTVEFNVTFTYEGNSGNYQWESPLFLTVYSESYQLTVVDPVADNSSGQFAVITLSDMFLANCGLGQGSNLEITIENLIPSEPFTVNMLTNSGIESNAVAELNGQITLTVNPQIFSSQWLQAGFPHCSFDVVVSSDGGDFIARTVNVSLVDDLQSLQLDPPSDLQAYEVGQDFISLHWEHDGHPVSANGYYVYYNDGEQQYRAFSLPVPVEQVTIDNLFPGRNYTFQVTAIDEIGRESGPVEATISTTCPAVTGWPVQLNGSPGGGSAIVDIDQDGADEIVVATSFGVVYLIERDGSYQTLTPPSGYDFDKILGCAVGDVDGDSQLEIVVSCQRKIEVRNQEQVSILLFNKNGAIWNVNEIASTNFNEEVASPFVAGTPVLFQANGDDYLEIALRTKANLDNGGTPHLYVWRYDAGSGDWVDFSNNFPVSLDGFFFNAPTAVDFDEDGFEELIVTSYGTAGVGTELKIIDFQIGGNVVVSTHGLPELDTGHETARVFGTLAAAEENGTFYIAGVAKTNVNQGTIDKVFVYSLDTDPVDVTLVWQTPWKSGQDFFGNLSGPAIGDLDGNSDLEIVYTLNGENAMRETGSTYEGVTYGWDLGDGSMEFQSTNIPYNPVIGGGSLIRSQPVTGLTTMQGSGEMAIFSGFSSYLCGHDPQS
ncbi:MAG: C25 family cysteine peptidase, partial [Candidatus Fermentibacteria bacterium]|nr:C25 family cysteine peptidase [Candidatus Fermentibacteria bacterium]